MRKTTLSHTKNTIFSASLVLILDRLTKYVIVENLFQGQSIKLVPGIFHITLVLNKGAAFGLFKGQRLLFLSLSFFIISFLIFYILQNPSTLRPFDTSTLRQAQCSPEQSRGTTGSVSSRAKRGERSEGSEAEGQNKWRYATLSMALGLILGGAIGNLVDRISFGYVIDFLDFRIWPVFNIADFSITIGAIVLSWEILRRKRCIPSS